VNLPDERLEDALEEARHDVREQGVYHPTHDHSRASSLHRDGLPNSTKEANAISNTNNPFWLWF